MQHIGTIDHAFEAAAAPLPDGWFAAVRRVRDVDDEHLADRQRFSVEFAPGKTEADWSRAFAAEPRRLTLITSIGDRWTESPLAEAERIDGPAAAAADSPTVAWTERSGGRWRLMLFTDGRRRVVAESEQPLLAPAVAVAAGRCVVACQSAGADGNEVTVYGPARKPLMRVSGARPRMAGSTDGRAFLVVERARANGVDLALFVLAPEAEPLEIPIPAADDYNINASLAVGEDGGCLWLAWESSPAFGCDERVGLHRDLNVRQLTPDAVSLEPAPGAAEGRVYIRPTAFHDQSAQNMPPILPVVCVAGGQPAVAFRRFGNRGNKCFGWDVCLVRLSGNAWTAPVRIGSSFGPADAGCALFAQGADVTALLPVCDHEPLQTHARQQLKLQDPKSVPAHGTQPAKRFRVEAVRFALDDHLPPPHAPLKPAVYAIPPSAFDVAPEPPALAAPPAGMRLVWADLHAHSAYSKCMSANDGLPDDVLRFERDILGCDVLCLTEHVEYMTAPEFVHVLDRIEAAAGSRRVPLYGVEWAKKPAHHTNFYAADRGVFDRLRTLLLTCDHLTPLYKRICDELPAGSVTAIRHFHGLGGGDEGVGGARQTESHDAEMERAMEAMQTRGNMMLPNRFNRLFPSDFLNAGARLGLVGGSDHSRGQGPNRYCLTGLWVTELTGAAALDAIRNRRTLAMSNAKVAIAATLGNRFIGESAGIHGAVHIQAQLSSARTIRRAWLIRDGEPLPAIDVGATTATVELEDSAPPSGAHWYSVTVEADSAYPDLAAIAHASPFFVTTNR